MENRPVPIVLLLAAAIPVFFAALGANSIWDANEAFYVETPRQMLETGDYVSPSFGGAPRFNKPVLSYWLVAGAYRLFGESVAIQRVVIALGAMGILFATYLIGRALGTPGSGVLAALLLATAPRFVFFSRRILIDIYITLFMALALACFVLAERFPERRRPLLLLMYVAIGCGVLTKGPVALVLPALAAGLWLLMERRLADLRRLMILPGALIVVAIVVPWYAAIYRVHGWEYITQFFVDENVGRFSSPITTARSALFFIPVLLGDILLPWAPLVAIPLLEAWRREAAPDPGGAVRRLLWWWVVVIVAAFSLSASKEDLYILPAIPAAAALVAETLIRTAWGAAHRGVSWVLVVVCILCVVIGWMIADLFASGYYEMAGAPALAALLAITGVLAIATLWRRQFEVACLTLACGFVLFNYVFVLRTLPALERLKPVPALAAVVSARGQPSAPLGFFNMDLPSMVYYARRPVTKLGDADTAARFFTDHDEVWVLAGVHEWEALKTRVPDACVAARRPLFAAKASDVLRGEPPPDVLLLTRGRACFPQK